MNFLFVTYQFPPEVGGTKTRVMNYIKHLTSMEIKVIVIVLERKRRIKIENFLGAKVYRCPFSMTQLFRVFTLGRRLIKQHKINVIHIYTGANIPFGLIFILYGKFKRLKTGVSLFGTEIQRTRKVLLEFLSLLFALLLVDRIGVNSKATLRILPRTFLTKTKILYPGVDPDIIKLLRHKPLSLRRNKIKKLLFVGRLSTVKGIDDLLRAFKLVLEKIPEVTLTIVGEGAEKKTLTNLAKELKVLDRVNFTGTLRGPEVYRQYQECNVFIMPSKTTKNGVFETFGMVFLEAALFKKPSVGTWCGGIPEAVIHRKTGLLVPEGNVRALADAIIMILIDKELAEKLGQQAYKRVIRRFTWRKATEDLIKMYT